MDAGRRAWRFRDQSEGIIAAKMAALPVKNDQGSLPFLIFAAALLPLRPWAPAFRASRRIPLSVWRPAGTSSAEFQMKRHLSALASEPLPPRGRQSGRQRELAGSLSRLPDRAAGLGIFILMISSPHLRDGARCEQQCGNSHDDAAPGAKA